jgi:hypothetical protein
MRFMAFVLRAPAQPTASKAYLQKLPVEQFRATSALSPGHRWTCYFDSS